MALVSGTHVSSDINKINYVSTHSESMCDGFQSTLKNRKRAGPAHASDKPLRHSKAFPVTKLSKIAVSNELPVPIKNQEPILNLKIVRMSDNGTLKTNRFGIIYEHYIENNKSIYLQDSTNYEKHPIFMSISTNLNNFKSAALDRIKTFYKLVQSDLNNLINYRMSKLSLLNHNSNIHLNPPKNSPNYRCGDDACFISSCKPFGLCKNCFQNCILLCFLDFNNFTQKFTMKAKLMWMAFLYENLLKNLWFLFENSETIGVSKLDREFSYVYFDNICEPIEKSDVHGFRVFVLLMCIIDLQNCENYINQNNDLLEHIYSGKLLKCNKILYEKIHSVLLKINNISTTFDIILSVLYFSKTLEFNYIYVLNSNECSIKNFTHVIQVKNNILFLNQIFEKNSIRQVKLSTECFFYWCDNLKNYTQPCKLNNLIRKHHHKIKYHDRIQRFVLFLNKALNTSLQMSDICRPIKDTTTRKKINGMFIQENYLMHLRKIILILHANKMSTNN
ncbi:hypothetical protein COBT_001580 [Conglomerata obtusa]